MALDTENKYLALALDLYLLLLRATVGSVVLVKQN